MLEAFKAYLSSHLANAEGEVKAEIEAAFAKVVDFVTGAEAKLVALVKAEVQHLTGMGYTVTAPAPVEPAAAAPVAEAPLAQ